MQGGEERGRTIGERDDRPRRKREIQAVPSILLGEKEGMEKARGRGCNKKGNQEEEGGTLEAIQGEYFLPQRE